MPYGYKQYKHVIQVVNTRAKLGQLKLELPCILCTILFAERVDTTSGTVTDQMITDNEWEMIEKHLNNGVEPAPTQVSILDFSLNFFSFMSPVSNYNV